MPVPNAAVLYLAILVGLLAGCMLGTQPSANGYLGRRVAHPLQAAVISFGSGFAILVAISAAAGQFPPRLTVPIASLPWWAWSGGAIGTVLVTASLIFVPRIGSLSWFAAVITGQICAALILDQWGLMGNPKSAASPLRIAGALLLIAGVLLITRAKALERSAPRPPSVIAVDEPPDGAETGDAR